MIAVGVDTHKDRHIAVALDLLGEISIEACAAGYLELEVWAKALAQKGQQVVFGVEGAGSYGAGLCEHLQLADCSVLEVERPRRRERRTGKTDRIDAVSAAKRVLSDEGTSAPRQQGTRVHWRHSSSPSARLPASAQGCSTSSSRCT
jgi:transposase